MNFERGLSPKEAMGIGKAAFTVNIDEVYEETNDDGILRLSHPIAIKKLEKIEAREIKHPSKFWFTATVPGNYEDERFEEYELAELRGKIVRYDNKDYYIPNEI